jgi:soluble lytic murein transglycosylase-like protein
MPAFAGGPSAAARSVAWLAVLSNGFSIRHLHRQRLPGMTRLYLSSGTESYVDVPTAEIVGLQQVESPALPAAAPPPSLDELVRRAGERHQLDVDFLHSVIRAESAYDPRAVSPKGARGLMQLMPATAGRLGVEDAFDPRDNVDAGARYLRQLLRQYDNDVVKALAAYNAGPESVARYRGVPPYRETRAYVARVIRDYNRRKLAPRSAATAPRPAGRD